jgi:hypothetical protein
VGAPFAEPDRQMLLGPLYRMWRALHGKLQHFSVTYTPPALELKTMAT